MARVFVTRRALRQVDEIDRYSKERWGDEVAGESLGDLFAGLQRLECAPGLLRRREDRSLRLRFYRVREHTMVCDVVGSDVYVLAIWHGAADFAERLERLEPHLIEEAELMARQLASPRARERGDSE